MLVSSINLPDLSIQVVITNLDNESIINVDAKKWPAALSNDGSSYYKVLSCKSLTHSLRGIYTWMKVAKCTFHTLLL